MAKLLFPEHWRSRSLNIRTHFPDQLSRDVLLLKLRSAIADKEWNIACANMETARGGWTCDWHIGMRESQRTINSILKDIQCQ
jgi:hypothetical protein